MKFHILSDVHLEFGDLRPPRTDADVVVLAGDIGPGVEGVEWAELSFAVPVIYVLGNHEFYGDCFNGLIDTARERCRGSHVHLLEDESLVVNGVRFLGATLWTDFALLGQDEVERNMIYSELNMTDCYMIRTSQPGGASRAKLSSRLTLARHCASRRFLETALGQSVDSAKWQKTVVVTHHAPSARSLKGRKPTDRLDAAYASALDHLVARADLWIHGHIHEVRLYRVPEVEGLPKAGRRVVSNPRGYYDLGPDAVEGFDPELIVEV
ncbi:MAG: metallophosphoesterase [Proteobacteria bacterium]|nr:metallophosphoesterase [Pseudomonadota bacterium]